MTVSEFYNELNKLYPTSLSCSWDNDGLMCCGDAEAPVKRVLVCLDATDDAIDYAANNGFNLILTHHPMIFNGLKSITELSLDGRHVIRCLKSGVSVISLHTRLDAGAQGVNDSLAEKLGLINTVPYGDDEAPQLGRIGDIDTISARDFALLVRERLGCVSVNAYIAENKTVSRVAVVGGGGNDFIYPAMLAGADAFVCGECRYNSALDAADNGLTVIEAGHYQTEFPVCRRLADLSRTVACADAEIYGTTIFKQIIG